MLRGNVQWWASSPEGSSPPSIRRVVLPLVTRAWRSQSDWFVSRYYLSPGSRRGLVPVRSRLPSGSRSYPVDCWRLYLGPSPRSGQRRRPPNHDPGLLVWRKADNHTAFTDGYRTWVNGPYGLQVRLNTARFSSGTRSSTVDHRSTFERRLPACRRQFVLKPPVGRGEAEHSGGDQLSRSERFWHDQYRPSVWTDHGGARPIDRGRRPPRCRGRPGARSDPRVEPRPWAEHHVEVRRALTKSCSQRRTI